MADSARVEELVTIYRGLGFETRVVPLATDRLADGCRACLASSGACVALLTRPVASGPSPTSGAR